MLSEFVEGYGVLLAYFLLCASFALVLRRLIAMPSEVFRKTLHLILLGSLFVWLYAFETWWISALSALVFIAMVYPLLWLAEDIPGYSALLTERRRGELKRSLVLVFSVFALLITVCWGVIGEPYLVLASVFAWGLGDAAAALVGKRYGSHAIKFRWADKNKSLEGTAAMFLVSTGSVFTVLAVNGAVRPEAYLPVSFAVAAVTAAAELYSRNGLDTVICPLAAAAVLIPLVQLWGV